MSGMSGSGACGIAGLVASPGWPCASSGWWRAPGVGLVAGAGRPGKAGRAQAPDDSGCGVPNPPAISCSLIFLRPRCSRDITVPTGVPMISAISR